MRRSIALIPVNNYKTALVAWKQYQNRLPTEEEVENFKKKLNGKIAGWAMPTGKASHIVALDFDGDVGMNTLNQLHLKPNVITPSGAAHVWIEYKDTPVKTGQFDNRWPGMELKGDGGYVIVQGHNIISRHSDGPPVVGDYELVTDVPTKYEELPTDLAMWVFGETADTQYEIDLIVDFTIEAGKNGRNNASFDAACKLRDLGLDRNEVLEIFYERILPEMPRSNHSFDKMEVRQTVTSAFSREAKAKKKQTTAEKLFKLIKDNSSYELWHDGAYNAYVTIPSGHNLNVNTEQFKHLLAREYFNKYNELADNAALDHGVFSIHSWAQMERKYAPSLRIAWHNNTCYYDLGNSVLEIDDFGWREVDRKGLPIKFVFSNRFGTLPMPERGGEISRLKKYVNIEDRDWPLLEALIVGFFKQSGPYPIGVFTGRQGSAKSTSQSFIANLIDPRIAGDRMSLPDKEQDLMLDAISARILSFDNVSVISNRMSDALSRLATGGGMQMRKLYTDSDMVVFYESRSILINGIGDVVTRSDLIDRSIIFDCPPITHKVDPNKLEARFELDKPYILGAVLDAVSQGIANYSRYVERASENRMVGFENWGLACGVEGLLKSYTINRLESDHIAINNSPVGLYISKLAEKPNWQNVNIKKLITDVLHKEPEFYEGCYILTAQALYQNGADDAVSKYDWPGSIKGFHNAFDRVQPNLENVGIKTWKFEYSNVTYIVIKKEVSNAN